MIVLKNKRVRFYDLSEDFQDALIEEVARMLRLEAITEGCSLVKKTRFKNSCWQEAYCRAHLIRYDLWGEDDFVAKADDEFWDDLLIEQFDSEACRLLNEKFALAGDIDLYY